MAESSLGDIFRFLTVKDAFSQTFSSYIRQSQRVIEADERMAAAAEKASIKTAKLEKTMFNTFQTAMGISVVIDGFTALAREAMKVEQCMTNIKKVMDDSTDWGQLLDQAQRYASEYGQRLEDVLSAVENTGRVLKDSARTMEVTKAAIENAIAGNMDLADSANYLMASLNQFGLASSKAQDIGDVWNHLANNYATTNEELAIGFTKAGAAAKQSGVNYTQLAAALTALNTAGIPAAQSANALVAFFTRMKSEKTVAALKSIGVQVTDTTGKYRSSMEVLAEVQAKLKNMSDEKQQEILMKIAGQNQYKRLLPLLQNWDLYKKAEADALANSNGSMSTEVAKQKDQLSSSLKALKTEFEVTMQSLSSSFMTGTFRGWIEDLTNILKYVNLNKDSLSQVLDIILKISKHLAILKMAGKARSVVKGFFTEDTEVPIASKMKKSNGTDNRVNSARTVQTIEAEIVKLKQIEADRTNLIARAENQRLAFLKEIQALQQRQTELNVKKALAENDINNKLRERAILEKELNALNEKEIALNKLKESTFKDLLVNGTTTDKASEYKRLQDEIEAVANSKSEKTVKLGNIDLEIEGKNKEVQAFKQEIDELSDSIVDKKEKLDNLTGAMDDFKDSSSNTKTKVNELNKELKSTAKRTEEVGTKAKAGTGMLKSFGTAGEVAGRKVALGFRTAKLAAIGFMSVCWELLVAWAAMEAVMKLIEIGMEAFTKKTEEAVKAQQKLREEQEKKINAPVETVKQASNSLEKRNAELSQLKEDVAAKKGEGLDTSFEEERVAELEKHLKSLGKAYDEECAKVTKTQQELSALEEKRRNNKNLTDEEKKALDDKIKSLRSEISLDSLSAGKKKQLNDLLNKRKNLVKQMANASGNYRNQLQLEIDKIDRQTDALNANTIAVAKNSAIKELESKIDDKEEYLKKVKKHIADNENKLASMPKTNWVQDKYVDLYTKANGKVDTSNKWVYALGKTAVEKQNLQGTLHYQKGFASGIENEINNYKKQLKGLQENTKAFEQLIEDNKPKPIVDYEDDSKGKKKTAKPKDDTSWIDNSVARKVYHTVSVKQDTTNGKVSVRNAFASFLKQVMHYTTNQTAAVIGNMMAESGGNPGIVGKADSLGSKGILQWTDPRGSGTGGRETNLKNFAKSLGLDYRDYRAQILFYQHEALTYEKRSLDKRFNKNPNARVEDSAVWFGRDFERPNEKYANYKDRIRYAQIAKADLEAGRIGNLDLSTIGLEGSRVTNMSKAVSEAYSTYRKFTKASKEYAHFDGTAYKINGNTIKVTATVDDKTITKIYSGLSEISGQIKETGTKVKVGDYLARANAGTETREKTYINGKEAPDIELKGQLNTRELYSLITKSLDTVELINKRYNSLLENPYSDLDDTARKDILENKLKDLKSLEERVKSGNSSESLDSVINAIKDVEKTLVETSTKALVESIQQDIADIKALNYPNKGYAGTRMIENTVSDITNALVSPYSNLDELFKNSKFISEVLDTKFEPLKASNSFEIEGILGNKELSKTEKVAQIDNSSSNLMSRIGKETISTMNFIDNKVRSMLDFRLEQGVITKEQYDKAIEGLAGILASIENYGKSVLQSIVDNRDSYIQSVGMMSRKEDLVNKAENLTKMYEGLNGKPEGSADFVNGVKEFSKAVSLFTSVYGRDNELVRYSQDLTSKTSGLEFDSSLYGKSIGEQRRAINQQKETNKELDSANIFKIFDEEDAEKLRKSLENPLVILAEIQRERVQAERGNREEVYLTDNNLPIEDIKLNLGNMFKNVLLDLVNKSGGSILDVQYIESYLESFINKLGDNPTLEQLVESFESLIGGINGLKETIVNYWNVSDRVDYDVLANSVIRLGGKTFTYNQDRSKFDTPSGYGYGFNVGQNKMPNILGQHITAGKNKDKVKFDTNLADKNVKEETETYVKRFQDQFMSCFKSAMNNNGNLKKTLQDSLKSNFTGALENYASKASEQLSKNFTEKFSDVLGSGGIKGGLANIAGNMLSGMQGALSGVFVSFLSDKLFGGGGDGYVDRLDFGNDSWSYNAKDYATTDNVYAPPVTQESVKIVNFNNTFNIESTAMQQMSLSRREIEKICEQVIIRINRVNSKASGVI